MDENLLSDEELADLRAQQDTRIAFYQSGGPEFRESCDAIDLLFAHIDATKAKHTAIMQQVVKDAYANGAAVGDFIKEQTDRITELESIMARVAALGVKGPTENLGIAAGRMTYMRDSLRAALKGDLTLLEAVEHMFSESGNANDPD